MAIEPHSPTWQAVKKACNEGIASAAKHLEAHGTPIEATEYHRGFIVAMRAILSMAEPPAALQTQIDVSPEYP